eukprot:gene32938-39835_t
MSGFVKEMIFSVPSALVESQAAEVRLQPTTGTAAYTTPGSTLEFRQDILPNTFADFSNTLVLTGRVVFGNVTNANRSQLLGTFASLFSTIRVRIGGVLVDEIVNFSQLMMHLFDMTMTQSDRRMLSGMLGFDPIVPSGQGVILGPNNNANGATPNSSHSWTPHSTQYSFAIPIPCSLTNTSTLWPLFCSQIQWEFVMADPSIYTVTNAGAGNIPTVTISQAELVFNTLRLADGPFKTLMGMQPVQPDGSLLIKTDSWVYTNGAIPAQQAAGRWDIPIAASYKSISRMMITATPADVAEKSFGGVNPNLSSGQLVVNNRLYPALPCRLSEPAEVLYQNYKSFGSLYSTSHVGSMDLYSFAKSSGVFPLHTPYNPDGTLLGTPIVMPDGATGFATTPLRNAILSHNKWKWCLDLESLVNNKESLFAGITTKGAGNSVLRLTIGAALPNQAHTVHIWMNIQMVIRLNINTFQAVLDY